MFVGRRKSSIDLPENRIHKIPADIQPVDIKIKYKARVAETSGYEDQSEVSKNQIPDIKNNSRLTFKVTC